MIIGLVLAFSGLSTSVAADEPPPRRSVPLIIAGASGLSAGLTTLGASAIFAATQPCVAFPGLPSGCNPAFDNTYAAPLILLGGIVTVLSIPLFSIGLERNIGPLQVSMMPRLDVGAANTRLSWTY